MLSISQVGSSGGAAAYYTAEDNYYFIGESSTEWFGKGSDQLGLSGAVDKDQFKSVLDGYLPDGSDLSFMKNGENKHRPGYDLTFSAPKSVSVLALIEGDKSILEAHNAAVKKTLSEIETLLTTRTMIDGVPIHSNTNSLVSALFMHDTSRNLDPQLHTHAIIANATFDADSGKWKTLATDKIDSQGFEVVWKNQVAFGALYRQFLKEDLAQMGYEFETVGRNGLWEIKGVPTDIFSSRRKEIIEIAEPNASAKSLSVTAKDSRMEKDFTNIEELRQQWKDKLAKTGFDKSTIIKSVESGQQKETAALDMPQNALDIKNAVKEVIATLEKQSVKFGYDTLLTKVMNRVEVQAGIVQEAKTAINEAIKSGELIATDREQTYFTTRTHLFNERDVSSLIHKLGNQQNQLKQAGNSVIAAHLAERKNFNLFSVKGGADYELKLMGDIQDVADKNKKPHIIIVPNKSTQYQLTQSNGKRSEVYTIKEFLAGSVEKPSLITVYQAEKISLADMKGVLQQGYLTESTISLLDTGGNGKNTGLTRDIAQSIGIDGVRLSASQENKKITVFENIDKNDRINAVAKLYTTLAFNNKSAVVQVKGEEVRTHFTKAIRASLAENGLLSERSTQIHTRQNVMIDDYKDRSQYKVGYTLEKTVKGKTESYRIEGISNSTNKLGLVNLKTGEKSALSVSKLNGSYSVFKDAVIEVKIGDKLKTTDSFGELKFGQHLSVIGIKPGNFLFRERMILEDTQSGKLYTLPTNKTAKLGYDYVESVGASKAGQRESIIAVLSQPDTNSKTVNDIKRGGDNVMLITSLNKETLEKNIKIESSQVTVTDSLKKVLEVNNLKEIEQKSIERSQSSLDLLVDLHIEKAALQNKDKMIFNANAVITSVAATEHNFTLDQVKANLQARIDSGQLIPLGKNATLQGDYVARENVELEKHLMDWVSQGKGQAKSLLDSLENVNLNGLTRGQANSASMILSSSDKVMLVQGYAGVGKTTQFRVVVDAIKQQRPDVDVVGLAPTHQATSEMRAVGMQNSTTIADFLNKNGVQSMPAKGEFNNKVFVIDETSMIGNKDMATLFNTILDNGGRIVLSGDHTQLKSFDSGSPLRLLYERGELDKSTMDQIVRQTESLRPAVEFAIKGAVPRSLATIMRNKPSLVARDNPTLSPLESVIDTKKMTPEERYERVANDFISRTAEERLKTVVVTPLNADKRAINMAIHDKLSEIGALGSEKLAIPILDRVNSTQADIKDPAFWRENKGNFVKQGQNYFKIESVDGSGNIVLRANNGDEKMLDAFRVNHKTTAIFRESIIEVSEQDRIRITATDRERAAKNNAQGVIEKIEDGKVILNVDGKKITYDPLNQASDRHLDLAYAGTDYALQGGSFSNVIMFVDNTKYAALDSYYVQISRAKHHVQAYINDVNQYVDRIFGNNSGERLTATEILEQSEQRQNLSQEMKLVLDERNTWQKGGDLNTFRTSDRLPESVKDNARFNGDTSEIVFRVMNDEGSHRGNYYVPINPYRGEIFFDRGHYEGARDGSIIVLNQGDEQKGIDQYPLSEIDKAILAASQDQSITVKLDDKHVDNDVVGRENHAGDELSKSVQEGLDLLKRDERELEIYAREVEREDQKYHGKDDSLTQLGNNEANLIRKEPDTTQEPRHIDKGIKEKELV